MTTDNREKFLLKYRAGINALERGKYRLSIENLEAADELVAPASRQSGEARIWLVTAYQAANRIPEATALARQLSTHPDAETRDRAKRLLYIIQAPRLNRPKEWLSEIPDLAAADNSGAKYVTTKSKKRPQTVGEIPEANLSYVNTQDNKFVWFALLIAALTVVGLILWGRIGT